MTSRPLRIAFTALTSSLAVSLSLWVMHASYEQRHFSQAAALRTPSVPAEINSHEVRENLRSDSGETAELFAQSEPETPMVQLENPPELVGIGAAPVSQNSSGGQVPPLFPTRDEIAGFPEQSLEAPAGDRRPADEPLVLPELQLEESAGGESLELPPLEPAGPAPETTGQRPQPPIVELVAEPLTAPRPPAWLSVQAALEAEVEELRQQQKSLEAALAGHRSSADVWKERERNWRQQQRAWSAEKEVLTEKLTLAQQQAAESRRQVAETRKQLAEAGRQVAATEKLLASSKREADTLKQQMEQLDALLRESQTVNRKLKNTLNEKLSLISRLENDARKAKNEIEELRSERRAVRGTAQYDTPQYNRGSELLHSTPSDSPAPALLPPLPDETDSTEKPVVVREEPVVPPLAGRPAPPSETVQPVPPPANAPRKPLIPADVCPNEAGRCVRCGACLDRRPEKKGLIYDLKDWFQDWREGRESCGVCEPICTQTGLCTQTDVRCHEETGLIPELFRWWTHRRDTCDCGCY